MEVLNIFSESLITSFPTFLVLAAAVVCVRALMRQYLEMKHKYDYKDDRYRQDIEVRISELTQEIQSSKRRFESVNHLLIDGNSSSKGILHNLALENIQIESNTAFVLTPFNSMFDSDYKAVKGFFTEYGYKCERGDDLKVTHNVLGHIIKKMASAEIVVANISGRNPNVFYELGIAHALGKDVIIIAKSPKDITFDVASGQVIIYQNEEQLKSELNQWLVSILKRT
ncbi:membrane protein [Aliivibrio wodanis]|uniref:Membrane protein n=1 Tax=Aliivibrio wodanis TaxID=80852 RepID=A0A090I6I0_9GAMM|nr:membrane protein [Aliivibrio wodanis]